MWEITASEISLCYKDKGFLKTETAPKVSRHSGLTVGACCDLGICLEQKLTIVFADHYEVLHKIA